MLGQAMLEAARHKNTDSLFLRFTDRAARGKPGADAVLAAIWTTLGWQALRKKRISRATVNGLAWHAAFSAFLYGRMIGCAAEIEDHVNRGKNMDTRTPASRCVYVA